MAVCHLMKNIQQYIMLVLNGKLNEVLWEQDFSTLQLWRYHFHRLDSSHRSFFAPAIQNNIRKWNKKY